MKQQRPYPQVIVTRKAAKALAQGHPWVFEGEVLRTSPSPDGNVALTNGCLVDVLEENGTWQGTGLVSQMSKIRVRIVSRNANDTFDAEAEEAEAEPADDENEEADDEEVAADGETKIVLDETPHLGAALSGTAIFASGASGKWALSRNGRLGFEPDEGSAEPDENDWQLFQAELQKTLQSLGGEDEENTTVVDVDKIVRPGVQLSGSVTFASGAKGTWYIGQRGLGVEPAEGSAKPTQKDVILFQRKLQEVLQKQGY